MGKRKNIIRISRGIGSKESTKESSKNNFEEIFDIMSKMESLNMAHGDLSGKM